MWFKVNKVKKSNLGFLIFVYTLKNLLKVQMDDILNSNTIKLKTLPNIVS